MSLETNSPTEVNEFVRQAQLELYDLVKAMGDYVEVEQNETMLIIQNATHNVQSKQARVRLLALAEKVVKANIRFKNKASIQRHLKQKHRIDVPALLIPKLIELGRIVLSKSIARTQREAFDQGLEDYEMIRDSYMEQYTNLEEEIDALKIKIKDTEDIFEAGQLTQLLNNLVKNQTEILDKLTNVVKQVLLVTGNVPSNNSRIGGQASAAHHIIEGNLMGFMQAVVASMQPNEQLTPEKFKSLLEMGEDLQVINQQAREGRITSSEVIEGAPSSEQLDEAALDLFDASLD